MTKVDLSSQDLWSCITFFRPNRPVLVTTRNRDGTTHIAPFAWCVPASAFPPMVTLALLSSPRKQHSLVNIERDREFVVNFPGHDVVADMVRASFRYPAGVYKAGILGFEYEQSRSLDVPAISQCRAHIECRLNSYTSPGDHYILVGDVVNASYVSEQYQDAFILDTEHYPPCLHLGQRSTPDRQTHTFMIGADVEDVDVQYAIPCPVPNSPPVSWPGDRDGQMEDEQGAAGMPDVEATSSVAATGFASPEGPCIDPQSGDLFVLDWAQGLVFRTSAEGQVTKFADTEGMPSGACLAPDGRLVVCDTGRKALLEIDAEGKVQTLVSNWQGQPFLGPNSCVFGSEGNLYFTDGDGLHPAEPSGKVYVRRPDGSLECVVDGLLFPGGLCFSEDGRFLYVAETFAGRIHRLTLDDQGMAETQEVVAELCGGIGPDGLALGPDGNLYVAHFGKGVVAVLDPTGRLLAELPTEGFLVTNVVFWNGALHVTELEKGCLLRLDVKPGL